MINIYTLYILKFRSQKVKNFFKKYKMNTFFTHPVLSITIEFNKKKKYLYTNIPNNRQNLFKSEVIHGSS